MGAMAPWVVTPSELKTAAAHYPEMSLSEAISVKTPILYSKLRSASTLYFAKIKLKDAIVSVY